MWGIIKGIGAIAALIFAWLVSEGYEAKQRQDDEEMKRVAACLEEISQRRYGKSFIDLDEAQRQVVMGEFKREW